MNAKASRNILITYAGETLCAAEWSRRLGGCEVLVARRLHYGWTPEAAVSTPARPRAPNRKVSDS